MAPIGWWKPIVTGSCDTGAVQLDFEKLSVNACGNVNAPFYHGVCAALQAGIPTVISSRHLAGPPHASKGYLGSLKSVVEQGAIAAGYLSGIKARILLMVALAHTRDRGALADVFARV